MDQFTRTRNLKNSSNHVIYTRLKFHKTQSGLHVLNRLPQLGFLIFFDNTFLVNLINHNLSGVEISAFYFILFFGGFFQKNQHFRSGNW
jgi:hypothetical protein